MIIKAYSSKNDEFWCSENSKFEPSVSDKMFEVDLEFYSECDNDDGDVACDELMGTVKLRVYEFFDLDSTLDVASDIYSEDETAFYSLSLMEDAEDYDDDKASEFLNYAYLSRLYIEPKFRRRGLANWILENIEELMIHFFRVQLHSVVAVIAPDGYIESENHNITQDKDVLKLYDIMTKTFERNGFKITDCANIYYKNYAVENSY